MRGIDHQAIRCSDLYDQLRENAVEHTNPAPAHKTVRKRLVRSVPARQREIGLGNVEMLLRQHESSLMAAPPHTSESQFTPLVNPHNSLSV